MNYKRYTFLLVSALLSLTSMAQPAPVKSAAKAVFSLTTFRSDGSIVGTSHGVFTGNGEAISAWKPFLNADSAIVVDGQGKSYQVDVITDCSELYDVCKFRVKGTTPSVQPATGKVSAGAKVWLLSYGVNKAKAKQLAVSKVETFMDKYNYYVLGTAPAENEKGCPLLNDQGRVVGLIEPSATADGTAFAVDLNYPVAFTAQKVSFGNTALNATGIRAQLPQDQNDALLALMMAANQGNEKKYEAYIDDFITLFPTSVNGYGYRARLLVDQHRLADADAVMQQALQKVTNKDEAHYELARIIYNQQIYSPDSTFTQWSLDKSAAEARQAYTIKPEGTYRNQEGLALYAQSKYDEALKLFESLEKSNYRNSELYLEIAQCKTQLKAPQTEIMQALDSAVALCPKPLTNVSAPYFLARGVAYDQAGDLHKALADYNTYDTLMALRANAEFYYTRYLCEMKLKRYQQALNDIAHTAFLSPNEPGYLAEMASLQLRFNLPDDAIKTADLCLARDPKNTDALIIKGLALINTKKKEEGIQVLQQAQTLGDSRAEGLIKKYK